MKHGIDDVVGLYGDPVVTYSSYWLYNHYIRSDGHVSSIAACSKVPVLRPTLLLVKFSYYSGGTENYPGYIGLTRMKGLESITGAAGLDDRYVGIGGNTDEMATIKSFGSSGETLLTGSSIAGTGYGELAVYVDPIEGECWCVYGRTGFVASPNNCIGGGNPLTGVTPTFSWNPENYVWYMDIRSSADLVYAGGSYEVPSCYLGSRGDDTGTFAGVNMTTWNLPTGWDLGLWSRVPGVLTESAITEIEQLEVGNVETESGIFFPFGYGEVIDPLSAVANLTLQALSIDALFGLSVLHELSAFSISSTISKSLSVESLLSLKGMSISAVGGSGRIVTANFSLQGLRITAEISKDKLINGVLTLKAFDTNAVIIQMTTANGTHIMSPLEIKARGLQDLDYFIMRYVR